MFRTFWFCEKVIFLGQSTAQFCLAENILLWPKTRMFKKPGTQPCIREGEFNPVYI